MLHSLILIFQFYHFQILLTLKTIETIVAYLNSSHDNYGLVYAPYQTTAVWYHQLMDEFSILDWLVVNKSNRLVRTGCFFLFRQCLHYSFSLLGQGCELHSRSLPRSTRLQKKWEVIYK